MDAFGIVMVESFIKYNLNLQFGFLKANWIN